jgi:hypothetical protein
MFVLVCAELGFGGFRASFFVHSIRTLHSFNCGCVLKMAETVLYYLENAEERTKISHQAYQPVSTHLTM